VIVDRKREGNEQCRRTHSGDFGHRAGACATDDQVGVGKRRGGVVDERCQFCFDPGLCVPVPQRIDLTGTTLMQDQRSLFERQQGQSLWNDLVERLGTQAATDHQQPKRPAASGKPLRWRRLLREGRAQRIADPLRLLQHVGKRREDLISDARQHLVGHASDRVLLVQHQGLAEQHTHQPSGKVT
jgi:hypothetical protein